MTTHIYEDQDGKITGRIDADTGSVIIKIEYVGLGSQSITIPPEAKQAVAQFLGGRA